MNHLAHVYLAKRDPLSIVGNLAADFLKGDVDDHPQELRSAIRLHRSVDAFTDSHPDVLRSKKLLSPIYGHYGGVVLDVLYDHLLAKRWSQFSDEPISRFAGRVYEAIEQHGSILPQPVHSRFLRMRKDAWLESYADLAGIRTALFFLSRRFRRPVRLDEGLDRAAGLLPDFEVDFLRFFPQLIENVNSTRE